MFRQKWIGTILVLATLATVAAPAQALPMLSFRIAGTAGAQAQELKLDVAGVQSYDGQSAVALYGGEAGVGLPAGIYLFAHYYRHTNEFGESLIPDDSFDAYVDMAGNEWGLDLEWRIPLLPGSPVKPYLGAGGSWASITLDGEVRFEGQSQALTTETTVYRIYALGGIMLGGMLDLTLRGGMSFGEDEAAQASYDFAGQTVTVSADYQGYFVAGSVGIGF